MAAITIVVKGLEEVLEITKKVTDWANGGYQITMTNAARNVAEKVKDDIRSGMETESRPLTRLRPATLEGPIRRDTNSAVRGQYGSKPLVATGKLVEDIVGRKVNDNEYEITGYSAESQIKLASNAKTSHHGQPFAGDTDKVTRDPLQVSEGRIDIIERTIVKDLENLIGI